MASYDVASNICEALGGGGDGYAGRAGAGAHCDWGALTLLVQDEVGGLEVHRPDGTWVAVWTGRYYSSRHRPAF
jgi:hypothetical protein